MTDNEIIKALKHCADTNCNCEKCSLYVASDDDCECARKLKLEALDLINRQKAEIERLKAEIFTTREDLKAEQEIAHKQLKEINRQQAEIERLKNEVFAKEQECVDMQEQRDSVEYNLELFKQEKAVVKAEAYKEAWKKAKKEVLIRGCIDVDEFFKELVGDADDKH